MSGGRFEYTQHSILEIVDEIERELNSQGKEKPKSELYSTEEFYQRYPEEKYYYTHPEEIQEKFREGIKALKKAYIFAQRIDWYLSGDDGEDSFLKRLEEELNKLEHEKEN